MDDWKKDPNLGAMGLVVGIIGTAAALIIAIIALPSRGEQLLGIVIVFLASLCIIFVIRKLQTLRQISYRIVSGTNVLTLTEGAKVPEKLRIFYKRNDTEVEVKNMQLVVLRIWNSGTVSLIKSEEYNTPLRISFDENAKLLDAEVIDMDSKAMKVPEIRQEEEDLLIDSFSLDSRQGMTLRLILTRYTGQISMAKTDLTGWKKGWKIRNWDKVPAYHIDKVIAPVNLPNILFFLVYFIPVLIMPFILWSLVLAVGVALTNFFITDTSMKTFLEGVFGLATIALYIFSLEMVADLYAKFLKRLHFPYIK